MARRTLVWLRWADALSTGLAAVAAVITGLLALHVVADAIGRTIFARPLPATLELSQFGWMPALTSLALGYALMRGEHIKVDLLTGAASPRVRRIFQVLAMTLTLAVVVLLAWAGIERAIESAAALEQSAGTAWVQKWPGRIALALGLVGLASQAVAELVRSGRGDYAAQPSDELLLAEESSLGAIDINHLGDESPGDQAAKKREML